MKVTAIKTRKFLPPKDDLWDLLRAIKKLKENSVVAVTSKVVSIAEGRCIRIGKIKKNDLIKKEADKYLPLGFVLNKLIIYTIKNNSLVAAAGIDESNAADHYILWPKNPEDSAKEIWKFFTRKFNLKNLGVIITDSRLVPLRRGVVGMAVSFYGFKPNFDYRGKRDIFGRVFEMETINLPDSLATAAVLEMGEGSEQTPLAVMTEIPRIEFTQKTYMPPDKDSGFQMPEKEDLFYPFLSSVPWKKGGGG